MPKKSHGEVQNMPQNKQQHQSVQRAANIFTALEGAKSLDAAVKRGRK